MATAIIWSVIYGEPDTIRQFAISLTSFFKFLSHSLDCAWYQDIPLAGIPFSHYMSGPFMALFSCERCGFSSFINYTYLSLIHIFVILN